jgi:mannose-1-phosphate guanylyltransferase/mannose-6-phosphate isomerase
MNIVPVILAGGIGERFWPLSRSSRPKQLLPIISRRTMMEETIGRAKPFCVKGVRPLVVTGAAIATLMRRALPRSLCYDCITEPIGKNTAPAIAAAAVWLTQKYGDAVMAVLPADHSISPAGEFTAAVRYAASMAISTQSLCVFGIRPLRPDTGYGYIQAGAPVGSCKALRSYKVLRFVEKPAAALARSYCAFGKYFWNSGMFVWKASVILSEIEAHMPQLFSHVTALSARPLTQARINRFYRDCSRESIDFGVMEKSGRVAMVCPAFSWDDVGSWESLDRVYGHNGKGTTLTGERIFDGDCDGSIIVNRSDLTVAACGLRDAVVVVTGDAVLVMDRKKIPDIRVFISAMKNNGKFPQKIF